jgi:hypothetical protein
MTGFLTSKFSGYLSIFGVLACLLLVWYIYNEGSKACEAKIVKETVIKYEKRNEILNNRLSSALVLKQLWDDPNW